MTTKRSTPRRRWKVVATGIAAAIVLSTVSLIMAFRADTDKGNAPAATSPEEDYFGDASFESKGRWYGLCAKNSVQSIEDFRRIVSEDPVLKTHFADFKWENARMGKLDRVTSVFLNFRRDGKIFRKSKPVELPAGDPYITDGKTTIRSYCCNDYILGSNIEEAGGAPAEGPASTEGTLIAGSSVRRSSGGSVGPGSISPHPGRPDRPSVIVVPPVPGPGDKRRPYGPVLPDKPTPVSETTTLLLVAIGVAAALVAGSYVRRKR
jgi:hypothetical protein